MNTFTDSLVERTFELFAIHAVKTSALLHPSDEARWNDFLAASILKKERIEKDQFHKVLTDWKWEKDTIDKMYKKYLRSYDLKCRVNEVQDNLNKAN